MHIQALDHHIDFAELRRLAPARYPLLMASSAAALDASARKHARWDMLLASTGEGFQCDAEGVPRDLRGGRLAGGFLDHLQCEWRAARCERPEGEAARWPFRGGWALFLGYELAREIEPILELPHASGAPPVAMALRCPVALLHDHLDGTTWLITEPGAESLRDTVMADLAALAGLPSLPAWRPPRSVEEDAPERFTEGVGRVLDYLAAGDVFQANLSRGWRARFDAPLDPALLHRQLTRANPAPFAGLFAHGDWAVVSASPERLVSLRGTTAETRPIAGTRPRTPGDDEANRIRELVSHPKERAEHVMLVDLERNDLGRVCAGGSVEVDELMTVESYAHVHHIVSNVRGARRADASPIDLIRAVFPGGTITGAPKVRCMQIIAELEGVGRGAYTGAMGWLNRDGDLDLNILIRSAEVRGELVRFRTGAGIVIDSEPGRELAETRAKARGMLRALGVDDD
ncbi:aminodeoxychorismate synthase component I [Lysobacter pythonis]|uniref:Aminodeoxychorismate synthase component I n=1 Tax=Solilutibacter pythonis TaxID=2483112 RepID=A0A3M2HYD5_9GAMM|nr:aminodeoxychorismate synthase component I [Lysobacter pythonis]RMH90844.1 aminodeoxychorismate synthase component I [Lysobacter pythonis]